MSARSPLRRLTRRQGLMLLVLLVAAFALGALVRGGGHDQAPAATADAGKPAAETWYTCSMHPQIRQLGPGQCPICGMDLIPVGEEDGGEALGPREIKLSPRAEKLAEVATAPVERRYAAREVRLVGHVEYDETRIRRISAWVPGRLDRLYVDFTGIRVEPGDHLVDLYSPSLIAAQEELLQALAAARVEQPAEARRRADATVRAARDKLALLGLSDGQIASLEKRQTVDDHVTILAPVGGIVIHKNAVEGNYVDTGTPIYTIADLSQVWVNLQAYEADLPWLRYGEPVDFETEAWPGEVFRGRIIFIDPVLDEPSRTVRLRVNVANPDGRLKPGMYVHGRVQARLTASGQVYDADLIGKWISPMHPEVIKDGPGTCDVCGMPLVPVESLGYVGEESAAVRPPLVIPATAPLVTGRRAVVYVADPDRPGVYGGREVVLGPRAGDDYVVESGLAEGERVVVRGNFKIDSALQILAKPSLMSADPEGYSPEGYSESAPAISTDAAFLGQLEGVYRAYFDVHTALSRDDAAAARAAAGRLGAALKAVDMESLAPDTHAAWMELLAPLREAAAALAGRADLEAARAALPDLTAAMLDAAKRFGRAKGAPVLVYHCPMAFDNAGADWVQETKGTENPYFGSAMFKCGTLEETLGGEVTP
ncbi:MAG: efflux RND transporter periplasmic adaptor subunit [Candidatus Krumholzibacteriia bacterium]|nr:efflux RND transporter periplasmic adaptor subunit [bacterium]MCB9516228.1 efflux RND transporter periplasmic adaptor subunit [Candidatus Latescibacterota bacterium]